jgi:ABC-type taurine transport system ATPase subunit
VAIARALAAGPEILLMDEPFSSLDTLTRERLQYTMSDLQKERGLTMITVTHSIEEAVFLGDDIMLMSPGPGSVNRMIKNSGGEHPDSETPNHSLKPAVQSEGALKKGETENSVFQHTYSTCGNIYTLEGRAIIADPPYFPTRRLCWQEFIDEHGLQISGFTSA